MQFKGNFKFIVTSAGSIEDCTFINIINNIQQQQQQYWLYVHQPTVNINEHICSEMNHSCIMCIHFIMFVLVTVLCCGAFYYYYLSEWPHKIRCFQ